MHPDLTSFAAELLVIFLAIGLHEYAHCYFADLAGDPTPRYFGRVTLNLFKHFEPVGALLIIYTCYTGFGIGWGRPAPMDSRKMRNPRWDFFIAVIAGPLSNLFQAIIYASILRILIGGTPLTQLLAGNMTVAEFVILFLVYGAYTNIALMLFNLIPFGPLDGHWLVGLLMPEPYRTRWFMFNRQIGMVGLMVVILMLRVQNISILEAPSQVIFKFLVGKQI